MVEDIGRCACVDPHLTDLDRSQLFPTSGPADHIPTYMPLPLLEYCVCAIRIDAQFFLIYDGHSSLCLVLAPLKSTLVVKSEPPNILVPNNNHSRPDTKLPLKQECHSPKNENDRIRPISSQDATDLSVASGLGVKGNV
ncbi:hypothetical protein OPQ81_006830 [Rhizoctonia solani]|nr:hypothetical protein OPQ81_006830 [Rhizoctonia solani]